MARVVVVDANQFRVISHSVKKTDPNDARNLALYLAKGRLPEVRMKEKEQAEVASLTQTRDRLVKLRTALKKLARFDGNVSQAAGALGLSRSALYRRLQRYGM